VEVDDGRGDEAEAVREPWVQTIAGVPAWGWAVILVAVVGWLFVAFLAWTLCRVAALEPLEPDVGGPGSREREAEARAQRMPPSQEVIDEHWRRNEAERRRRTS
jgi:hypothetical protein